jgi:hypothetical protein
MKYFKAPWGWTLILVSAFASVALLAVSVTGFTTLSHRHPAGALLIMAAPVGILLGCALFTVRGYSLGQGLLLVHRLFWATPLPLAGLQAASYEPNAMRWSLRTFGNGGFFSISGFYRNRRLGSYRAFVTDLKRTVVLRFPSRTIVVSPEVPEQFVCELMAA